MAYEVHNSQVEAIACGAIDVDYAFEDIVDLNVADVLALPILKWKDIIVV